MGFLTKALLGVLMLAIGIVPAVAFWMEAPAEGAANAAAHDAPRDTPAPVDPAPEIADGALTDKAGELAGDEFDWLEDAVTWANEEARREEAERMTEERLEEAERMAEARLEENAWRREEWQSRDDGGFRISIGGGNSEDDLGNGD